MDAQVGQVGDVTQLLKKWRTGDREAESQLFQVVLPDLRRLARYYTSREKPDHILQPTAVVNEAYLRLVRARDQDWQSRQHFFAIAARAMRRYLIDHARARPKVAFVVFDDPSEMVPMADSRLDVAVAVDTLLEDLDKVRPDLCSIVELKFFLGLTDEEAAETLGMALRSFQRRYGDARRWLFERLQGQHAGRDRP
jgi:RNA polymerase sigma factor (TIGR02999 family)